MKPRKWFNGTLMNPYAISRLGSKTADTFSAKYTEKVTAR
jgi:hypothetical protein